MRPTKQSADRGDQECHGADRGEGESRATAQPAARSAPKDGEQLETEAITPAAYVANDLTVSISSENPKRSRTGSTAAWAAARASIADLKRETATAAEAGPGSASYVFSQNSHALHGRAAEPSAAFARKDRTSILAARRERVSAVPLSPPGVVEDPLGAAQSS